MNNYYWAGGDETNNFLESATLFLKWHWSHGHSKYYDQNRIFEASSYLKVFWSLILGFFSSPIPGSKVSSFIGSTVSLRKIQNQISTYVHIFIHFYLFLDWKMLMTTFFLSSLASLSAPAFSLERILPSCCPAPAPLDRARNLFLAFLTRLTTFKVAIWRIGDVKKYIYLEGLMNFQLSLGFWASNWYFPGVRIHYIVLRVFWQWHLKNI